MDSFKANADGYTELEASSLAVGLPEGLMGNSEVGHLNIGAGRVVWQDVSLSKNPTLVKPESLTQLHIQVVRIDQIVKNHGFPKVENIKSSFAHAKEGNGRLHLLGLVSDGGVHSHQNHLYALLETAKEMEIPEVYIHFFGDGRDTDPKSAVGYMQELLDKIKELGIEKTTKLATAVGRYYAMDRDKRYVLFDWWWLEVWGELTGRE